MENLILAVKKKIRNVPNYHLIDQTGFTNQKPVNLGNFNFEKFSTKLNLTKKKEYTANDYLNYLFECLKISTMEYKNSNPKYFMIFTGARGFDWNNDELIKSSKFIFLKRNILDSYTSIREKYLQDHNLLDLCYPIGKKSLLYWLETYKRISNVVIDKVNNENFFISSLDKLQMQTDQFFHDICTFLDVTETNNFFNLTFCGIPYGGNANEYGLNTGKIQDRPSKIHNPLTSFEKKVFDLFEFYDGKKCSSKYFGVFDMLKIVFISVTIENSNKYRKEKYSIKRYIEIVILFIEMFVSYFAIKNRFIGLKFIKKGNSHINTMPLWIDK